MRAPLENPHNQPEIKCDYCYSFTRILRPIRVLANTTNFDEIEVSKLNSFTALMEKSMLAGNYHEACDYCNRALEIDPNSSTLWENKAICKSWISTAQEIAHGEAQEIITYLNAAKQADPDSVTYRATASSISSNTYSNIEYLYLKMSPDRINGSKKEWSDKAIGDIVNYLNLMELCFTISPSLRYLDTAVKELSNLGKVKNWIVVNNKVSVNSTWLKKYNYDAVNKREQYIKSLKQLDKNYNPPLLPGVKLLLLQYFFQ